MSARTSKWFLVALSGLALIASCQTTKSDRLEAALQIGVEKGYPGASAAIEQAGGRPIFAAAGYGDLEHGIASRTHDCFTSEASPKRSAPS